VTKGVRKAGKTLKDAERRRLAKRSRAAVPATPQSPPAGWSVLWCDGGSRGNPGPAAYAFVIEDGAGAEIAAAADAIGVATVGTAEYRALVAGLEAAARLGLHEVEVRTDSRIVAEQMGASPPPLRNPRLAQLRDRAIELTRQIGSVTVRWVPGERNERADSMVADLLFARDGAAPGLQ
jgi:ribonuclease H / adenosylcobalamin/alpha-ribazole phosphatase